jgi:hypothetical protein
MHFHCNEAAKENGSIIYAPFVSFDVSKLSALGIIAHNSQHSLMSSGLTPDWPRIRESVYTSNQLVLG